MTIFLKSGERIEVKTSVRFLKVGAAFIRKDTNALEVIRQDQIVSIEP